MVAQRTCVGTEKVLESSQHEASDGLKISALMTATTQWKQRETLKGLLASLMYGVYD